jgi:hypothetical protein
VTITMLSVVLILVFVSTSLGTQICIQNCPPITPEQRVRALYKSLVYTNIPAPITIATGSDNISLLTDIFEPSVSGRCWPLGVQNTFNQVKLFFWGSASQSVRCLSTSIIDLVVNTKANTIWVRTLLTFQEDFGALNPIYGALRANGGNPYVIDQTGRFTMGQNLKIKSYDIVATNLGVILDGIYSSSLMPLNIDLLCQSHSLFCQGANAVYSSYNECSYYFGNATQNGTLTIGSWNRANEDSFVCRINALSFASKNPIYCVYLTPAGVNSFCTPANVATWQSDTARFFPAVPQGSTCSSIKSYYLSSVLLVVVLFIYSNMY